jgi:hypothetical protein
LEGLERGIPQLGIVCLCILLRLTNALLICRFLGHRIQRDGKKKKIEIEAPPPTGEEKTIPMFKLPEIMTKASGEKTSAAVPSAEVSSVLSRSNAQRIDTSW